MSDTIRELVIQEFVSRAAVIRTTASPPLYETDCGQNVYRAEDPYNDESLPCVSVWPGEETAEPSNGAVLHKMRIAVEGIHFYGEKAVDEGYAASNESASVVAERILGDLIKCFTTRTWERRRLIASPASPVTYDPPYAERITYTGGGPSEYEVEGGVAIGATAEFEVAYWTKTGDPFAQ